MRLVNGGTADNSKAVVLKVNDVNEAQQDITLTPGKSQVVNFKVTKATPGTYNVSVEGLSSSFQVQAGTAAGSEAQDNTASLPIIGIIFVGGLLIIVFVIILIVRQRSSNY